MQVCGPFPDQLMRCAEMIEGTCAVDFIDLNVSYLWTGLTGRLGG